MLSYYIFNNKIVVLSAFWLHFTLQKLEELNVTRCFSHTCLSIYGFNFHK